ncbi:MAG TPA: hypothetical protein VMT12_01675 [Syntrophales bacterium]|nr:hypothetical protein [Syntrophales bacterium]
MKVNSHLHVIDLLPVVYSKRLPELYVVSPVINISEDEEYYNQKVIYSNEYGDEETILNYGKEMIRGIVKIITMTNINTKGRYVNILV